MKQYTSKECAELLGVTTSWVRYLIIGAKLRGKKMGRDWWVTKEDLDKFMATPRRKPGRPKTHE